MKCPYCRTAATEIYNSRATKFGSQTWRRRRCQNCRQSFTTYEAADLSFLQVAPAAGRPQPYSRLKLYAALADAFSSDPTHQTDINHLIDTIESKLLDLRQPRVTPADISRLALTTLKHFNTAAFMRYLATHLSPSSSTELKNQLKQY